jgi:hypothetical protein
LQIAVKGDAKVMSRGPRQKNGAGRLNLFGNVLGDGDRHGWDASGFDGALDQSDGLMADRSSRSEQRDVVSNRTLEPLRIHVVADEAEEVIGQGAQHALGGEFLQALNRKDNVDVDIGVIVRIFQLMNDLILVPRRRRHAPKSEIAEWMANVEGRIAFGVHTAGAYQRQPRFRQRPS